MLPGWVKKFVLFVYGGCEVFRWIGGALLRGADHSSAMSDLPDFWEKVTVRWGIAPTVAISLLIVVGALAMLWDSRSPPAPIRQPNIIIAPTSIGIPVKRRFSVKTALLWMALVGPGLIIMVILLAAAFAHGSSPRVNGARQANVGSAGSEGTTGTSSGGSSGVIEGPAQPIAKPVQPRPRAKKANAPGTATGPRIGTVNAPGGFVNFAENHGPQTVNNYGPARRVLTDEQRQQILAVLTPVCPFDVSVRHVQGNSESQDYADQIANAIKDAGCTLKPPRWLIDHHNGRGVMVALHDRDGGVPAGAEALAAAMNAAHLKWSSTYVDAIEPGSIYVFVELNPAEVKPSKNQIETNAPNGIAISGGTVTNPTVNNYGVEEHVGALVVQVTDASDGHPIEATCYVNGGDPFTAVANGSSTKFRIPIGTARLDCEAPGYPRHGATVQMHEKFAKVTFPLVPAPATTRKVPTPLP